MVGNGGITTRGAVGEGHSPAFRYISELSALNSWHSLHGIWVLSVHLENHCSWLSLDLCKSSVNKQLLDNRKFAQ